MHSHTSTCASVSLGPLYVYIAHKHWSYKAQACEAFTVNLRLLFNNTTHDDKKQDLSLFVPVKTRVTAEHSIWY